MVKWKYDFDQWPDSHPNHTVEESNVFGDNWQRQHPMPPVALTEDTIKLKYMKKLVLSLLSVAALVSFAHAGDHMQVAGPDALVCRYQSDLQTFMLLNQGKSQTAVRALYQVLQSQGRLMTAQSGTEVEVLQYFNDGTTITRLIT